MRSGCRAAFLAASILLALPAVAGAQMCAGSEIGARGEPASYRWLALVKARGNWRSKVRAMPGLGAPYANYNRAAEPVERCISGGGTIVCTVTARPCRP